MSDGHSYFGSSNPLSTSQHRSPRLRRAESSSCEPASPPDTVTERLNNLLQNGGPGYILRLCQKQRYLIQQPISFRHPNQEISTEGYPEGDDRAMLVVSGPEAEHSVAVDGTCGECDGVKLRNIQIDGMRREGAASNGGGGNIEMGGDNSNQLIEYVRTFNTRSWTCLHIAEGHLTCNNATIQHNDIGPCGLDTFQQWADGISLACRNSVVRENMIVGATDGGIVVFGSPGSIIEDNTIWVLNQTLLGGINLVDVKPFDGDYRGTIVRNNDIYGGFATDKEESGDQAGNNFESAIIKIGIAVGPRTWFGAEKFGDSRCQGAVVTGNRFSGAMSYAIAVTSANNFTILDNTIAEDTAFIGSRGPNCTDADSVPSPGPWIVDWATVGVDMNDGSGRLQKDFVGISDGDSLTCVLPPSGGDFWPFGRNPSNSSSDGDLFPDEATGGGVNKGGVAAGVILGILALAAIVFFGRKWYLRKSEESRLYKESKNLARR